MRQNSRESLVNDTDKIQRFVPPFVLTLQQQKDLARKKHLHANIKFSVSYIPVKFCSNFWGLFDMIYEKIDNEQLNTKKQFGPQKHY